MKVSFILIILFLTAFDAFAQRNVSGIVVDENNKPIVGAEIWEVSTRRWITWTNVDGEFQLRPRNIYYTLRISAIGFDPEYIEIRGDTIITVILKEDGLYLCGGQISFTVRRQTIGVDYDIANSLFGVRFDAFHRLRSYRSLVYEISAQTNFQQDYGFGGSIGLIQSARERVRRLDMVTLNYRHKNYLESANLRFNNVSLRGYGFIMWRPRPLTLFVEPAFQSLNDKNNVGLIVGLHRYWRHHSFISLSVGYFNDYWTYSARFQYALNWRLRLQASYERIDRFDFFNVGLVYTISEISRSL